jgi:hypothetical protein
MVNVGSGYACIYGSLHIASVLGKEEVDVKGPKVRCQGLAAGQSSSGNV